MRSLSRQIALLLIMIFATPAFAADVDSKATFFSNIYLSLCMKNISDLEVLRSQLLQKFPSFPKDKAAPFLNGMDGDAWPVVSSLGNFVIALPKGKKLCAVYAPRANQHDVENRFLELVSVAPQPFVSEKRTDETKDTIKNGETHTIGFIWSLAGIARKISFILTTSSKEDADIQALLTVSVGGD